MSLAIVIIVVMMKMIMKEANPRREREYKSKRLRNSHKSASKIRKNRKSGG